MRKQTEKGGKNFKEYVEAREHLETERPPPCACAHSLGYEEMKNNEGTNPGTLSSLSWLTVSTSSTK